MECQYLAMTWAFFCTSIRLFATHYDKCVEKRLILHISIARGCYILCRYSRDCSRERAHTAVSNSGWPYLDCRVACCGTCSQHLNSDAFVQIHSTSLVFDQHRLLNASLSSTFQDEMSAWHLSGLCWLLPRCRWNTRVASRWGRTWGDTFAAIKRQQWSPVLPLRWKNSLSQSATSPRCRDNKLRRFS